MVESRKIWNNPIVSNRVWLNKISNLEQTEELKYQLPLPLYDDEYHDLGGRFVDINGDGFDDLLYSLLWCDGPFVPENAIWTPTAYLNTGDGWELAPNYVPPYILAAEVTPDTYVDFGAVFVDVDHNGFKDLVYSRIAGDRVHKERGVFLNNGNGWVKSNDSTLFLPQPIYDDWIRDLGARFVDLDGDGFDDVLYTSIESSNTDNNKAFLNTGNGWLDSSIYKSPINFATKHLDYPSRDNGVRFVDVNPEDGLGLKDIVYYNLNGIGKGVYLNNGNGWTASTDARYFPPVPISDVNIQSNSGSQDLGVRFVDLNNDTYEDIIQYYADVDSSRVCMYLNEKRIFQNTSYQGQTKGKATIVSKSTVSQTSISKIENDLICYPNPVKDILNIESIGKSFSGATIYLYDISGKAIKVFNLKEINQNTSASIDLSFLSSGMYFIKIKTNKEIRQLKIIKRD